jgi:DNA topoisomerase-3
LLARFRLMIVTFFVSARDRKCQWLICWLDCDREGENIAFEVLSTTPCPSSLPLAPLCSPSIRSRRLQVIDVCRAVNPRLKVFRAHFSALIPA